MAKYNCNNCSYKTNSYRNFNNHINRKIPCYLSMSKNKLHGNSNKNCEIPYCKMCKKYFSREDTLLNHNKKFHIENNEINEINEINGIKVNADIIGNENNQNINNIQTQNIETQNIINNPIIIQPIINIHPYEYNDINDLTLFE